MIIRHRWLVIAALLVLLAVPALAQDDASSEVPTGTPQDICDNATPAAEPESREYTEPEDVLEADTDYRAIFCTSVGPVYIDLLEDYAPETVNNFVFLAQENYYNNTIFHRVIADFMAQAGDPTGTGTGGPGYQFGDEFVSFLTFENPGQLAMANAGPGTNGSQFFITTAPTPHLNYRHTIFGEVLQGQETVESIELRDPQAATADTPTTDLNTVVIITEPDAVETTYESSDETYGADYFMEQLGTLNDELGLPVDLATGLEDPETIETDAIVENAPEDVRGDYETLLTENEHDFRVQVNLTSTECSPEYFFETLTYTVDAYADASAAATVLESETLQTLNEAADYELIDSDASPANSYVATVESCGEGDTAAGRVYLQRGRYLVRVDGVIPPNIVEQVGRETVGAVLEQNATRLFEAFLIDAYRAEIN